MIKFRISNNKKLIIPGIAGIIIIGLAIGLSVVFLAGNNTFNGDSGSGDTAIDDEYDAESVLKAIVRCVDEVFYSVPNGIYTNHVVDGDSGTAMLTGQKSYEQGGTGDHVWDIYKRDGVTIVFNNYEYLAYNIDCKIDGTVTHDYYRRSDTYAATGNTYTIQDISFDGSNVNVEVSDISDTVNFQINNEGDSGSYFYGTITGTQGTFPVSHVYV